MAARQLPLFEYQPKPQYETVDYIKQGAQAFAAQRGRSVSHEGLVDLQVDSPRAFATARQYAAAPAFDSRALPAFDAMRASTREQYEHLTKTQGVKVEVTQDDPYPNVQAMAEDLRTNKRIKVLSTEQTGGHPYFTNEENDQFRAVHDAYGHAALGRGFTRHGEEAAYRAHAQMYPPEARPALEMETRGQNSYLNYGPTGDFGEQKVATLQPLEQSKKAAAPKAVQQQFPGMR